MVCFKVLFYILLDRTAENHNRSKDNYKQQRDLRSARLRPGHLLCPMNTVGTALQCLKLIVKYLFLSPSIKP